MEPFYVFMSAERLAEKLNMPGQVKRLLSLALSNDEGSLEDPEELTLV